MIVIAVLLLLVVAAAVVFVLATGATHAVPLDWDRFNLHLSATPLELFLSGVAALLIAEMALALAARSQRKRWATRRELKRLRRSERRGTTGHATPTTTAAAAPASAGTTTAGTTRPDAAHASPTAPGATAEDAGRTSPH